jgi:sulfoxide reductase heme-binding subunit YedZ
VKAEWYLSRGTGITSLVLLTLVVVLGVLTRSARPLPGLPRFVTAGLHRNTSLLAVLFLAVHVVTAVLDPYALTGVLDVFLPFRGGYRPLWVGMGTLALDVLVALVVTSLLRHRIPDRLWRTVHGAAYACWPLALLHGLGSGTDAGTGWARAVALSCVLAVSAAVGWRTTSPVFLSPQESSR